MKKLLFALTMLSLPLMAGAQQKPTEKNMGAYLFTFFSDATHSLFMAISYDGYNFTPVNHGEPIISGDSIAEQIDTERGGCEAPNVWKRIGEDKWVVMYDIYSLKPHNFGFVETTDFKTFTPLGRFNEGQMKLKDFTSPKHGCVIPITKAEATRLENYWNK